MSAHFASSFAIIFKNKIEKVALTKDNVFFYRLYSKLFKIQNSIR